MAATFSYGLWFRSAYKKTGNEYTKMFFRLGMIESLSLGFYGIPIFINAETVRANGVFYILGTLAFFVAIYNPFLVTLTSWNKIALTKFFKIAMPLFILILGAVHTVHIPAPSVDVYGIIHWNVSYPFNIVVAALGMSAALVSGYFLFTMPAKNAKTAVKKTLFSITFLLGGIGGWSMILTTNTILLAASFGIMFLGFTALWAMFFVELIMKEPHGFAGDY